MGYRLLGRGWIGVVLGVGIDCIVEERESKGS